MRCRAEDPARRGQERGGQGGRPEELGGKVFRGPARRISREGGTCHTGLGT